MDLPDLKMIPSQSAPSAGGDVSRILARLDNRHVRALRLTPSQFDVIATLGTPRA